jgi:phosphopantothenoylcysteine decarboxylase/phosphopantothenate--cysteine ligase
VSSRKFLVIYGGTEVPIDSVRKISNFSSGKTGSVIATYFKNRCLDVTVLRAKNAVATNENDIIFSDFSDLKSQSLELLDHNFFDAVVMLAAVSDYEVDKIFVDGSSYHVGQQKIPSNRKVMLELRPTEKLIKYYSKFTKLKGAKLIAFKLTSGADQKTVEQKVDAVFNSGVDGVIHNDLTNINSDQHPFTFYANGTKYVGQTKIEMAECLYEVLK